MPFWSNRRVSNTSVSSSSRCRLLCKNGHVNAKYNNCTAEQTRSNFFLQTSISSWAYLALVYATTFLFSWLVFALMYYAIGGVHNFVNSSSLTSNEDVCIENIYDFLSILLFSIETQHTIGYGHRRPTTKCLTTILILIIQSIGALFIQNIMAQAVYMKFSRPQLTVLYTPTFDQKCFLIRSRDNIYLCINVAHHDRFEIINSKIRIFCYKRRITKENEVIPWECYKLDIVKNCENLPLFLPIQLSIVHLVDENSPLKAELSEIQESTCNNINFEIVATLDGIYRITGYPCHLRTSYSFNDFKFCTADDKNDVYEQYCGFENVGLSLRRKSRGCTNDLTNLLSGDDIVESIDNFVGSQFPEIPKDQPSIL
ncbi:hypothetical protein GJ496_007921 [Pomphorhynchus laevis]|nr:hypothetical protein GJ496_007921 [Pomphorhynchus laevis]